jgi:hypothetical protein
MKPPTTDIAARRTERRLCRALRHRNASPFVREIKERLDADIPRRLEVFAGGAPEVWAELIRRAQDHIERNRLRDPSSRPCDYTPWRTALTAVGANCLGLMGIAEDLCRPPWPDSRQHLIEFALTYLEADPMLFRSGYTKRHLLNRLRQCALTSAQSDRLVAVLKRAVVEGTGLEEFGACCRIAAAMNPPGLSEWLRPLASKAKLNRGRHLHILDLQSLPQAYGEKGYAGWSDLFLYRPPRHAIPADLRSDLIRMTPKDWVDPENQAAVNAWRMLRAMERRGGGVRT